MNALIHSQTKNNGFTLIEMLVVIVILITVGLFITSTLFLTLRSASKTAIINQIRDNGNYAMNQIVTNIRSARSFSSITGYNSVSGNETTYTDCTPASNLPPSLTQHIEMHFTDFSNQPIVVTCDPDSTITIANANVPPPGDSLIDTSKIDLTSCQVTCTQATVTDVPSFNIVFILSNINGTGALVENQETQTFQASVNMLNNIQNAQSQ